MKKGQSAVNKDSETRVENKQYNIRKRVRNPEFDLNRSTIPTETKQRKTKHGVPEMAYANRGPANPVITDLSDTIMVGAQGGAVSSQTSSRPVAQDNPSMNIDGALDPTVRTLVTDGTIVDQRSLEDKVRKMVRDEMVEVKRTIEGLTKTIENLSRLTAPSQGSSRMGDKDVQTNGQNIETRYSERQNASNVNIEEISNYRIGDGDRDPRGLPWEGNVSIPYQPQSHSRNGNNGRPIDNASFDFRQIRIDKLGINFDNRSISIDDFIFRLEHLRSHYNIPEREVVRDFHLLLSDSVKDWYWAFIESHGVTEWPVLRLALLSQYKNPRSNFEIMRDLVERKQENHESIDAYFHTMNRLRSKLTQPISEYDMIKIMKRNINMNVARIVYPISVSSVEQLRIECNEAERNFPRREVRSNIPPSRNFRQVNEIYLDEEEPNNNNYAYNEDVNVDAVQIQKQIKTTITCWNCRVPGHVFMDCPVEQRSLFCYKCGKPEVTTPKCPNCTQKNLKSGVAISGEPRQKENPVAKIN